MFLFYAQRFKNLEYFKLMLLHLPRNFKILLLKIINLKLYLLLAGEYAPKKYLHIFHHDIRDFHHMSQYHQYNGMPDRIL